MSEASRQRREGLLTARMYLVLVLWPIDVPIYAWHGRLCLGRRAGGAAEWFPGFYESGGPDYMPFCHGSEP